MEGFLCYDFGGFIHGGVYFRNFTVAQLLSSPDIDDSHFMSAGLLEAKFNLMAFVSGVFSSLYELHFFYQMFGVLLH